MSGKKIIRFLKECVGNEKIEDLSRRYAAVCADLNNGEVVIFTAGNLMSAVRASIAIPGLFTPVFLDNRLLVDGGILEPLPVRAVRELGADFVVAVDAITGSIDDPRVRRKNNESASKGADSGLNSTYDTLRFFGKGNKNRSADRHESGEADKLGALSVLKRSVLLNQRQLISHILARYPVDFLIRPDLAGVGVSDFHRAEKIIEIGRDEAEKIIGQLKDAIRVFDLKGSGDSTEN